MIFKQNVLQWKKCNQKNAIMADKKLPLPQIEVPQKVGRVKH